MRFIIRPIAVKKPPDRAILGKITFGRKTGLVCGTADTALGSTQASDIQVGVIKFVIIQKRFLLGVLTATERYFELGGVEIRNSFSHLLFIILNFTPGFLLHHHLRLLIV